MDRAVAGAETRAPAATVPPVVVYTGNDCHWCGKAKQYLTRRGIPYTEHNVEEDPAAAEAALALAGRRGVPVITVGTEVILGFQRRALDALLGLGAPDATTEASLPLAQDTLRAAADAGQIAWTPEQQAIAATLAQQVDPEALCGALGPHLDYNPAHCDHTFRYVRAVLADHPPAGGDTAAVLAMLGTLGITCDCGVVFNICMR